RLAGGERTTFRELIVRPSAAASTFEVVLTSGIVVRVPSSFDGDALARLLEVVARACCSGDRIALEGVRIIAKLFIVERESTLAGGNDQDTRDRRQAKSRPVLDELRAWIDRHTPLGKGLLYLDRQWNRLLLFVDDGNIEATNNRRERELRRLVLGRRNWLFTWLDDGGKRTADILTIVATCIAYDVNPRAYLHKDVHA